MEHAFLIGTRAKDVDMRDRFMAIINKSLSTTATARLAYVLAGQNWDTLGESYWLAQASQLLLGGVDMSTAVQLHPEDFWTLPPSQLAAMYEKDSREPTMVIDDSSQTLEMSRHETFLSR
jgi:transformation/transcription domain-associated protein